MLSLKNHVNETFNSVACLKQIHSKFRTDNTQRVLLIEGHSDSVFLPPSPEMYLDLLGKRRIKVNPFGNKTVGQGLTHKSGLKRSQMTQNI